MKRTVFTVSLVVTLLSMFGLATPVVAGPQVEIKETGIITDGTGRFAGAPSSAPAARRLRNQAWLALKSFQDAPIRPVGVLARLRH